MSTFDDFAGSLAGDELLGKPASGGLDFGRDEELSQTKRKLQEHQEAQKRQQSLVGKLQAKVSSLLYFTFLFFY